MLSRRLMLAVGLAVSTLAAPGFAQSAGSFGAAVASPGRPATDTAQDANRKPADMLAFARVRPGMKVLEMLPGGGYFTRLFSAAVGPSGKVYAYVPEEMVAARFHPLEDAQKIADEPGRGNVQPVHFPTGGPVPADMRGTIDLVWTSQNYHDLHNLPDFDATAFNHAVFEALKPGGVFIVLDHSARPGTELTTTKTLHRIDSGTVRREVEAAGLVFEGASPALTNPDDTRLLPVFDASIRGKTDQFVYRFRKPLH